MAIHIDDDFVSMKVHGSVAAIVRLRRHGATDGHRARVVSCLPGWNPVIMALTIAGLLSAGHEVGDRLVDTLRQELR